MGPAGDAIASASRYAYLSPVVAHERRPATRGDQAADGGTECNTIALLPPSVTDPTRTFRAAGRSGTKVAPTPTMVIEDGIGGPPVHLLRRRPHREATAADADAPWSAPRRRSCRRRAGRARRHAIAGPASTSAAGSHAGPRLGRLESRSPPTAIPSATRRRGPGRRWADLSRTPQLAAASTPLDALTTGGRSPSLVGHGVGGPEAPWRPGLFASALTDEKLADAGLQEDEQRSSASTAGL